MPGPIGPSLHLLEGKNSGRFVAGVRDPNLAVASGVHLEEDMMAWRMLRDRDCLGWLPDLAKIRNTPGNQCALMAIG